MRIAMLIVLGTLASGASAQVVNFVGHPAPLYGFGSTFALQPTPTMVRLEAARQAKGLAFLNANAHSADDLKVLAEACQKVTAAPSYCAIPEMRKIGRVRDLRTKSLS